MYCDVFYAYVEKLHEYIYTQVYRPIYQLFPNVCVCSFDFALAVLVYLKVCDFYDFCWCVCNVFMYTYDDQICFSELYYVYYSLYYDTFFHRLFCVNM